MAQEGLCSTYGLTEHMIDAFSLGERAPYLRDAEKDWIAIEDRRWACGRYLAPLEITRVIYDRRFSFRKTTSFRRLD